jgi:hypothetical protein
MLPQKNLESNNHMRATRKDLRAVPDGAPHKSKRASKEAQKAEFIQLLQRVLDHPLMKDYPILRDCMEDGLLETGNSISHGAHWSSAEYLTYVLCKQPTTYKEAGDE